MRVALLAHARFPIAPPFVGGLESFTWHLARGLRRRGVDVSLFAAPGSDPRLGAEELAVDAPTYTDGARPDIAMPPAHEVREAMAYAHAMRTIARRDDIDVVHDNALHHLPVALAGLLPQPMLLTLHTPLDPWLEPALRLSPEVRTTAVSAAVARMWSRVTDATVVRNGVDLDAWRPGPGGTELVWFGRLVPEKAPHVAAEIARAAGLPLRLAGPIIDRDYVAERLAPLLDDRIRLVGHLGPAELGRLVGASAAALVTPAWDEPYGLVSAEAMACGTPVLGLDRGGVAEAVWGDGGLAIDPEVPLDEAVEALRRVLAFDRRAVRRHAERHCSLDAAIDAYLELYCEASGA